MGEAKVRLYVGGLSPEISASDLKERFAPLGSVQSVVFPPSKYGLGHRGFAYVDFQPASDASLRKLISAYSGCKWRGGHLRIETAREYFEDRLRREWAAEAQALELANSQSEVVIVPEVAAEKPARWPAIALEKTDKWTMKRDFDQDAQVAGIKLYFPRLRKLKTVPKQGLGRHKRSFQRVESVSLHQLSRFDSDDSLHDGSKDVLDHPLTKLGHSTDDDDAISSAIAKERQMQLELLNKMFPTDSVREPEVALGPTTSVRARRVQHGVDKNELEPTPVVEQKKGRKVQDITNLGEDKEGFSKAGALPHRKKCKKDEQAVLQMARLEDEAKEEQLDKPSMWVSGEVVLSPLYISEDDISDVEQSTLGFREEELSPKSAAVRLGKKDKNSEQALPQLARLENEAEELTSDEPSMWVSGEDVLAPLHISEDDISDYESLQSVSEDEEESPRPPAEAPKTKDRKAAQKLSQLARDKRDGKGLKSEEGSLWMSTEEILAPFDHSEADISSHESDKSLMFLSKDEEGSAKPMMVVQGKNSRKREVNLSQYSRHEDDGKLSQSSNSTMWVSGEEMDPRQSSENISEHESDDLLQLVSEDQEETGRPDAFSRRKKGRKAEQSLQQLVRQKKISINSEVFQPWVSGEEILDAFESSDVERSGSQSDQPSMWVSGLEISNSPRRVQDESPPSRSDEPLSSASEEEEESSKPVGIDIEVEKDKDLEEISSLKSTGCPSSEDMQIVKPPERAHVEEKPSEKADEVLPSLAVNDDDSCKVSQIDKPSKWLQRSTWKALVGETGRVVFSLQQLTSSSLFQEPSTIEETPSSAEDNHVIKEPPATSSLDPRIHVTSNQPSGHSTGTQRGKEMRMAGSPSETETTVLEVKSVNPVVPTTDVCPFMKSANAEKEWIATRSELRSDYRAKHKQAARQTKKLWGKH